MQRQKTIAKWLSVVLLTTIAIASYILLSTIGKSAPSDSAVAGAGNTTFQTDVPTPPLVYSTLPRACETIDGLNVAHVGGSSQDTIIDYANFCGKTLVFFRSQSNDRDVKESGLYAAVFDSQTTLESTIKIADENAKYLASSMGKNGLTVFIQNQEKTDVILFSDEMKIGAKTSLDRYDSITPVSSVEGLYLCFDSECMRMLKIDGALNATYDNFVYQSSDITIVETFYINGKTLIFAQDTNFVKILQYSQESGFICHFSQDKSTLLQVLPIVASNEQTFVTLIKSQDALTVNSFDIDLHALQSRTLPSSDKAVMLTTDIGIEVLCGSDIIRYCPHLDFLAKSEIANPQLVENSTEYHSVCGADNYFISKTPNGFVLLKKTGDNLSQIFACNGDVFPLVQAVKTVDNSMRFSLFFDCENTEDFSYMCFGSTDAFYLSLTTSPT